jgi:hypothetical protein
MDTKSVINLKPIFFNKEEEYRPKLNSIFLYIFLFFQFLVIICILYFFFKIELIFLYTNLLNKEQYNEEDKRKYNYYMYGLKNIITMNKYCEVSNKKWYPKFGKGKNMLTLDQHSIVFNTEDACKQFLNI